MTPSLVTSRACLYVISEVSGCRGGRRRSDPPRHRALVLGPTDLEGGDDAGGGIPMMMLMMIRGVTGHSRSRRLTRVVPPAGPSSRIRRRVQRHVLRTLPLRHNGAARLGGRPHGVIRTVLERQLQRRWMMIKVLTAMAIAGSDRDDIVVVAH